MKISSCTYSAFDTEQYRLSYLKVVVTANRLINRTLYFNRIYSIIETVTIQILFARVSLLVYQFCKL